mmetsp:Transcript_77445/g.219159  ORF Transcript_77445/g.219159 Transcript_77445/m.219159 type:complete len:1236 (-) Transcript_77445:280-3987(-)
MAADGASTALVPKAGTPAELRNFQDLDGLLAVTGVKTSGEGADGDEVPDLAAQVKALEPADYDGLWQRVLDVTSEHMKNLRLQPTVDDEASADAVHAVATLLAEFAEGALDASKDRNLPPTFVEVATMCQELLLTLRNGHTQALIARALERVCTDDFEGREDFYGGVLMFLLGKCIGPKTTSADVTRLYKVRELIAELDWEHESIESLQRQLLLCARSPNFVRSHHGSDMLCLFYTVHPGFTAEVNETVKSQVAQGRANNVLKAYAVGLYKAWKAAEAGTKVQVEQCVQDWGSLAIHSARKNADRARAMLEEFHRNHHDEPVNELLCRLYGPLLWRNLKVANWQVRENAARLVQYAFPLLPGELGVAEKERELTKQLRLLRETLGDPSEPVRRVGCSAVCVILKNYWDMMPPADVADLVRVLVRECARDKKSPLVRAAVAEGFRWILENPLAHPTVDAVLPHMADLLNDKAPIVRAAFVDLLAAVSHCRSLSVAKIVSHEQLLLRLASEHAEGQAERLQRGLQKREKEGRCSPEVVAGRLARLLAPSLFQQDLVQQVARCQYLMQHFPLALLALLAHAQDAAPAPERVKLAAALFRCGLREAAQARAQPRALQATLRAVGVLLAGAQAVQGQGKGKKKGPGLPKELEKFVYEHIREEDFMGLLRASHEEDEVAAKLRGDLLYAVSALDPARLPNTAELVRHELTLACRGSSDAAGISLPRLTTLMRIAVRWNLLGAALEPAWERLLAAATRLSQRQAAASETQSVVTVLEATLREPDVRAVVLPAHGEALRKVAEALVAAFAGAWRAGLAELGSASEPWLLGPAAPLWPRVLGVALRVALHLEHRPGKEVPAARAEAGSGDPAPEEESSQAPAEPAPVGQAAGFAEATLAQVGEVLTCSQASEALQALETVVGRPEGTPARKRARGPTIPADIDHVLQVHERLLEALNVALFLSVLKRKDSAADSTATPVLTRDLDDKLWRWTSIADVLRPREEGPRLPHAWAFGGRLLQQMAHAEVPTPDVIEAAMRLLRRTSDEVPADDAELKKVLQALFQRLEFEPQLVRLVALLTGREALVTGDDKDKEAIKDTAPAAEGMEPGSPSAEAERVHPRVRAAVLELIPNFRNLRAKFMPEEVAATEERALGHDQRRILASPTPQKVAWRTAFQQEPLGPSDIDGESVSESAEWRRSGRHSPGNRSFSVRSRSPPPPVPDVAGDLEEAFQTCLSTGASSPAASD